VFAGFKGGLGSLVGVTGGYLIGFIFTALAVGTVTRFFGRSFPALIAGMVLGLVLCYAFGSLWFLLLYTSATGPIAMSVVLAKCVIPFLLPDAVKIALAAILVTRLKNLVP
jgi:biotin transport system substrate-specific component